MEDDDGIALFLEFGDHGSRLRTAFRGLRENAKSTFEANFVTQKRSSTNRYDNNRYIRSKRGARGME